MPRPVATALLACLVFASCLMTGCASKPDKLRDDTTLRVMSFNLRRSNVKDTAFGNGWFFRRAGAARVVESFGPDIIGTQEGFHNQVSFLEDELDHYMVHGVGRDNGKKEGEYTAIFYRAVRFRYVDGGHVWLSDKPDRPGSNTWWSPFSRMMSWAVLYDRKRGRTLLVVNTHFDNLSSTSRERSAVMLAELIEERRADAVVVTGDFNCAPGSRPYDTILGAAGLADTFLEAGHEDGDDTGTHHGFSGDTDGPRIDWVLASPELTVLDAGIDRTKARDRRYPSDHFPVTAVLDWPKAGGASK